jgi:hypothetical protein
MPGIATAHDFGCTLKDYYLATDLGSGYGSAHGRVSAADDNNFSVGGEAHRK